MLNWQEEIKLIDKYSQYLEKFVDMPSGIQAVWDGHRISMNTAKQHIKLLQNKAQPVHSVPYRAGAKTNHIEKVMIVEMMNKKTIKPAQTR